MVIAYPNREISGIEIGRRQIGDNVEILYATERGTLLATLRPNRWAEIVGAFHRYDDADDLRELEREDARAWCLEVGAPAVVDYPIPRGVF